MNYSKIESAILKAGTCHYKTSDNFIYSKSSILSNVIYLKCVLKGKLGCKGTAKLCRIADRIHSLNNHNHEIDAYKRDVLTLKRALKRAAQTGGEDNRVIFDNLSRIHSDAASQVSFSSVESSMAKARRRLFPSLPQTLEEVKDKLDLCPYGNHFKAEAKDDNNVTHGVIFFHNLMRPVIEAATTIMFDGETFLFMQGYND